jgi:hypothetical protein
MLVTSTSMGTSFYFFQGFQYSTTANTNILGETLLQNMVTFFDRGSNNRIGFALGQNCDTVATTSGISVIASSGPLAAPVRAAPSDPPRPQTPGLSGRRRGRWRCSARRFSASRLRHCSLSRCAHRASE